MDLYEPMDDEETHFVLWFHAWGKKSAEEWRKKLHKAGFEVACEPSILAAKNIMSDVDYSDLWKMWRISHREKS